MPRYDLICANNHEHIDVFHSINEQHPLCSQCGLPLTTLWRTYASTIATDDIPGGIEIRHGICNPDGTPKRYYSKTEIKRAANEAGLCIAGDTPGSPYKVNWSGKTKDAKDR